MGSPRSPSEPVPERLPLSFAAAARAGLGPLRHTASTGSTNDDLVQQARRGDRSPAVLVADHQTSGRGRLGRRWRDAAGGPAASESSLLFSARLTASVGGALDRAAAVSAAALAAAAAALADTDSVVVSKWPNDLLIETPGGSGKLAGILSEFVVGDPPVVVVGVGLNVAAVPDEPGAACLAQAGVGTTRDELLARLLEALPGYLADPGLARAELRAASATIGRRVRVDRTGGASVVGTARDVDDAGRLVVDVAGEELRIEAGDVFHLR